MLKHKRICRLCSSLFLFLFCVATAGSFLIENQPNKAQQSCIYKMEIYNKMADGKIEKHGIFCGSKTPGSVIPGKNLMRIIFNSNNSSLQKTGISGTFNTDVNECAINNGHCQHKCINIIGSYKCTCQNGFTLHKNGYNCTKTTKTSCKYEISSPFGSIESPNYPNLYPKNKNCVWKFTTKPGHRIRLNFLFFETESQKSCSFDYLEFYDGSSAEDRSLGKFCGSKAPDAVVSSRNELYVVFRSNSSIQKKGFWAMYSTVCGGVLEATTEKKYIYSHSRFGEEDYHNKEYCVWTIKATPGPGYKIKVSFLTFDLEAHKDCGYDYVEMFTEGNLGNFNRRFCGSKKPSDIFSFSKTLEIHFRSDNTFASKGFSIVYNLVKFSNSTDHDMVLSSTRNSTISSRF